MIPLKNINRYIKSLAALTAVAMLCGCADIPDRTSCTESVETAETAESTEPHIDEIEVGDYEMTHSNVRLKLNAEGGVFESTVRTDGEYDGNGYIILDKDMTLTHIAEIKSSQHYRIGLAVQSYTGAVIRLTIANKTSGMYYIPADDSDSMTWQICAVDSLYLTEGPAILNFYTESGTCSVDYILIEDSDKVSMAAYRTGSSSVTSNSTVPAIGTMKYLAESYGKKVITGQNVTPGTNAEIDAIFKETGRYPAMRCGELASFLDEEQTELSAEELRLATEWGKKGGLVSYTWHWYSPDLARTVYSAETELDLADDFSGQDLSQLALLTDEEMEIFLDNGILSEELYKYLMDIDRIAEPLTALCEADIPVIFQPIPNGDSDLYWWGGNAENYKALWRLVFDRLTKRHSLGNLIWVWNGSSADYYPGDKYCDIIGQEFFEGSSSSFADRLSVLSKISPTDTKPVAITACDTLPSPDFMVRDNAMWLWVAIGSGESIIAQDGSLTERYNDWQSLNNVFNGEVCVTLDELPDFSEYAFSS